MKKSIYISRRVLNTEEIQKWAKEQGFATCVPDMHVTIAFDAGKHDWEELPLEAVERISILHPDERAIEKFLGGAIVLEIYSTELVARWAELVQSGLYWKWADYHPHITITYNAPDIDLGKIMPFPGVIHLGPEMVVEVVHTWKNQLEEITL